MSFLRHQQVQLAERFLKWQYEKKGHPLPDADELRRKSQTLVQEAQRIAQRTGRNVISIVKELIQDFKKL